jgi:twitching motility protein PilT
MNERLRNPDLDELVRELNQGNPDGEPEDSAGEGSAAAPADGWSEVLDVPAQAEVVEGEPLDHLLAEMLRAGASDLLVIAGLSPVFRIDGRLIPAQAPALDGEDIAALFKSHLSPRVRRTLEERGSGDFSLRMAPGRELQADTGGSLSSGAGSWRFRVNVHRQRGQLAAAIRSLPREVPSLAGLNLPVSLGDLIKPSRGLVLLCGPTGSGKTSTLAALVSEINRTRSAHIITIEDPIEYEHRPVKSIVEHIEVGRDTRSFHEALRASLRQDPDVILVGEMRDLETVATALTAAETGHLVLSTLHTNDSVQAVHRIVDVFPPQQQSQIRHQLALALHAIVTQQLVPRADGRGRVPAVELMLATYPVRHHIRNDQLQKLYNEITLGKRQGMVSLEESLANLASAGVIDVEEARVRASHPEELESRLRTP